MDQLKVYWGHICKHHFWILCGFVFVSSIGCWWYATGDLVQQTQSRESTLEGLFSQLMGVISRPVHHNNKFVEGVQQLNTQQAQNVYNSWKELYDRQKKTVMQWPKGLPPDHVTILDSLGADEDIHKTIRETYRNYIVRNEPPRLKQQLGLLEVKMPEEVKERESPVLNPVRPGEQVEKELQPQYRGMIMWKNFDQIFQRLKFDRTPSTRQMRYAQEDLWVLSAIFAAMAETNPKVEPGTEDAYKKAKIKEIIDLQIGQRVPPPSTRIMDWLKAAVQAGGGEGPQALVPATEQQQQANLPQSIDDRLKHRRYITLDGKPLAFNEDSPSPEFKLMPVYMVLLMDQRRLPALLANFANSELPIITRFQLYPPDAPLPKGGEGGLSLGGYSGESAPSSRPYNDYESDRGERDTGMDSWVTATARPAEFTIDPYDMTVVLRGYALIYQKPVPEHFEGVSIAKPQEPDMAQKKSGGSEIATAQ